MAGNTASGTGSTGHKKPKVRRGNRVQRFAGWSPQHKKDVLKRLGVSLEDFRSYGGAKKGRVLNRAFDGQNSSGGGGNPSGGAQAPAFDRNDPAAFTAPMSYNQTLRQGQAAANLQYGPQEQILGQQAVNIPHWFNDYRTSLTAAQQQQQALNQPMLDQTAARADNQAPSTGLDPNTGVGHDDVLAAAGRKALIEAGLAALQGTTAATTGYLAGRTEVANQAQQQASTDNTNARKQLAGDKGNFLSTYVGNQRENERKYGLESAAFGLDQYKAEAGAAADAAGLKAKTNEVVTSGPFAGLTKKQITKLSPAQKTKLRNKGKGPKGPTALELAKYDKNKDGKLSPGEAIGLNGGRGGANDPYGNTPKQQRAANSTLKKARSVAGQITQKGDTWKDVYQLLVVKYPTGDSDTLKAAAIMSVGGRIGPKLRASLLKAGINPALLKSKAKAQVQSPTGGPPSSGAAGYPYGTGAGQVH